MPSGFFPNRNFAKELEAQPEFKNGLAEATVPAREAAKSFAPVQSGAYRDGIKIVVDRKDVYLSGTDWKSNFIEYGTIDTPVFAPLRRGVRAAGLKFKEERR